MEKMTVKELAKVAGVSADTIRRTAKELFPEKLKKGVRAVFTKEQSFDVMKKVRKKNLIHPTSQPLQSAEQPLQSVEVIAQAVAIAMQTVMMPMMEKLLTNQKALPEPVRQDSYSLVAYCIVKGIKVDSSNLALHGRALKEITKQKGIKLKKIPDERWGFVNSYPVEILDEYFAV